MKMTAPSFVTKKTDAFEKWVIKLTRQLEESPMDAQRHAGHVSYRASDNALDGGGYGDPHDNGKPDFVKRDDAGWV